MGKMLKRIVQNFACCDAVFFLDYPTEICLAGLNERKGKVRTDMPWVEDIDEVDENFISFVKEYSTVNRPKVLELLSLNVSKDIFIFRNRDEANDYLSKLNRFD